MINQELEFVRIEVSKALANLSGGNKGQLEAFSEHPPADKNKHPRRHPHLVDLEGGAGCGPSVAVALTAPSYVLETRSRRRPFPPIKDHEFFYSPWRRAVNSLEEHQQAWIRYCYGFDLTFRYQTLICEYVWNEFNRVMVDKKLQSRVSKKLISIVWLAAQEVAAARNNDTYREYAGAALAKMMSVDRSTWLRVYAGYWSMFKSLFVELDILALRVTCKRYEEFEVLKVMEM